MPCAFTSPAHEQAEQPAALVEAEVAPIQPAHQLEQFGIAVVFVNPRAHRERHCEQVAHQAADQRLGEVTGLVRVVRVIELSHGLGERLRRLGQPGIANVLIDPRQIKRVAPIPEAARSAPASSSAVRQRSSGRLASARSNMRSSAGGKLPPSGGTLPRQCS